MPDRPPLFRVRSLKSCLGLALAVLVGLVLLFAVAGRRTPAAWRARLVEAGETLRVEDHRRSVPDADNAAIPWIEFERRWEGGDPVFLRGRSIPRELYIAAFRAAEAPDVNDRTMVDWTLARSVQALRAGTPTDADRALLNAGLELVADDLDRLVALTERPAWQFDDERPAWEPIKTWVDLGPRTNRRVPMRVVYLGQRGEQLGQAFDWLTVRALFAAERADAEQAGRSLLALWQVLGAFRSEPFAPEFSVRRFLEPRFVETLERALPVLEPTDAVLELERRMAAFDLYADLRLVFLTRRIEMLEWFERVPGTPTRIDEGFARWVHWAAFGFDVQSVASIYQGCIDALDGPRSEALRELSSHEVREYGPWALFTPSVQSMLGYFVGFPGGPIGWIHDVQLQVELARVALADRVHGRAAALELVRSLKNPFDGKSLRSAIDPDGSQRFWSTNEYGFDNQGGANNVQIVLPPESPSNE